MNYDQENLKNWLEIQKIIFPAGLPKHCEWTDLNQIVEILNIIGSYDNSNHMFYPTGGGLDVESANLSSEPGCIEIHTGLTDILKPEILIYESFKNPLWNYFRIETAELKPTGIYKYTGDYPNEELAELEPKSGKYLDSNIWEINEYKGQPLPKTARPLTRHFRGAFVIFSKTSFYNRHSSTYDGRHNKMTSLEFRAYIEKVIQNGW
jgi:hypothetical protein